METNLYQFDRYLYTPVAAQCLATGLCTMFLGALAMFREKASRESTAFCKLSLAIGLWLTGFSLMYAARDGAAALWWAKAGYFGITLIPATAFDFSARMLRDEEETKTRAIFIWTLSILFLCMTASTGLQFDSLYRYNWGFYPRNTLTSIPFLVFFFGILFHVLCRYVAGLRKTRKGTIRRKQGRMILLAYLTSNIGFVDFLPSWGIQVYPFGYVSIIIWTLLLFYSISHYRFITLTPSVAAEEIIEILQEGVMVLDEEGVVHVANPAICNLMGISEQEIIGTLPPEPMVGGLCFKGWQRNIQTMGTLREMEYGYQPEIGDSRTFSLSTSFKRSAHGEALALVCIVRDVSEKVLADRERENLIEQLREALANVKQLKGMLPICASCKKIRDDKGYWQQIESYILKHTDAEFTHGLCPTCAEKAYEELARMKISQPAFGKPCAEHNEAPLP